MGAFWSLRLFPMVPNVQRLPFSSAYHSPATTILQRLPFSSAYHSPATAILQRPYYSPALRFSSPRFL